MALLVPTIAAQASASHAHVTGDVYWDSAGGYFGIHTEFVLHDNAPGKNPDRGWVVDDVPGKGWRKVKVECVVVNHDGAFYGGTIVEATGGYTVGQGVEGWFGPDGDRLGSHIVSNPCPGIGDWTGGGVVVDGVVKFH
jgi:hypothetical protein